MTRQLVLNEIFEKCSEMTNDKFWKTLFTDAARNKMPKGFFLNNKKITYRHGNKIHHCEIPKSPKTAYETLIAFFQNIGCMNSEQDIANNKKDEEENLPKSKKITKWSDLKKKNIKDHLIENFISKKIKEHNMNKEEETEFITTVNKGFLNNAFKTIKIKDGEIESIEELLYDSDANRYYFINNKQNRTKKNVVEEVYYPSHDKKRISLYRLWVNFIERRKDSAETSQMSSCSIMY